MHLFWVFLLLLAVRLVSVFVVRTYYVPDEYWQSLEVAHKMAFGYGYLTWEWAQGIRSYIYPGIIAGVYKALEYYSLDTAQLLTIVPRILQAILSAYSDYRFYLWMSKRKWALFMTMVPWYWFYTGSRTLANTLEASLTTIALSYFPWYGNGIAYFWFAAICCFLRPTATILWIPLCIYHMLQPRVSSIMVLILKFLLISLVVAGVCIGIDSYFYGRLVVTPLEFLKYNILHNIGSFYGSNAWHWYFTTGLPTVLGINFLPFLWGTVETIRHRKIYQVRKQLLVTIILSLIVLSLIDHKEFRFVTSLLPLCLYIATDALTRWSYSASRLKLWPVAILILMFNIVPAWYLSTFHQKGPIELMSNLQSIAHDYRDENNHRANIVFLMPCHSTPFYSHVHENVTMRFLTCEPNLNHKKNYMDEADKFYKSPMQWLRANIPAYPRTAMPSHVVLFEPIAKQITNFLLNYKPIQRIQNAEFVDDRHGKYILIYERLRSGEENTYNRDEFVEIKDDARQDEIYNDFVKDQNENNHYEKSDINVRDEHNIFN